MSVEDKARLTGATLQRWWLTVIFAALMLVFLFGARSLPRQWEWWLLVAFVVAMFVVVLVSTTMQWRSLARSGVAQSYVRTPLWVFVVMDIAFLSFFTLMLNDFRVVFRH